MLILGGTGKIGRAISKELLSYNHNVTILCRSLASEEKAESLGAKTLSGNIKKPDIWVPEIHEFDGIIHAASTNSPEMGEVDTILVSAVLDELKRSEQNIPFLYTGGIWLFGDSKGEIIDEDWDYNSISAFKAFTDNAQRILETENIHGIVIHPANVVPQKAPHVPEILLEETKDGNALQLPVALTIHWPVVTLNDLAGLYRLALLESPAQEEYIACTKNMSLSEMVEQISNIRQVVTVAKSKWIEKYGSWVEGYFLNQKVSSQKAIKQLGFTLSDI